MTVPAPAAPEIERWLRERLGGVLGIAPQDIDAAQPFAAYGLSSAQAIALSGDLETWLGRTLEPTLAYEHPCVRDLAAHLSGTSTPSAVPARRPAVSGAPIAIVGAACRLPGGVGSADELWRLLAAGRDGARLVPADRWDADRYFDADPTAPGKAYTQLGGFLDDLAGFDAQLFGLAPAEALRMDPQQRLLLELSWAALEDAGVAPDRVRGTRTGVYVGMMDTLQYAMLQMESEGSELLNDPFFAMGAAASVAAGRIAYLLDLRGPAVPVDTACSSSLVSTHLAVQGLRTGDCDLALVGGASAIVHPNAMVQACKMGMLAPDGRCKTFDEQADGFLLGEGCAVLVLERLEDAQAAGHPVLAVIEGSAINQDGRSNGLNAPSREAQADVIRAALADAGVAPDAIDYVEAHGSGTQLGDAIEAGALRDVFGQRPPAIGPVAVGSVKTNLGHLQGAAGATGLLKTALALDHGAVPATLHLEHPNPAAMLDGSPLIAATEHRPWPRSMRRHRAAVSSFGWSGTNAHVVLAAAPAQAPGRPDEQPWHVLPISAASPAALRESAGRLRAALMAEPAPQLRDVALTLAVGRAQLARRQAVVCRDLDDARAQLAALAAGGDIAGVPDLAAPQGREAMLRELAGRWERGETIDWDAFLAGEHARRVRLPGYPFQHTRFWPQPQPQPQPRTMSAAKRPDLADWCSIPSWEPRPIEASGEPADGPWLVLADDGPAATLAQTLRDAGRLVTVVERGPELRIDAGGCCLVDPARPEHFHELLRALTAADCLPTAALHGWTPTAGRAAEQGLTSALALIQALERAHSGGAYELTFATTAAQVVDDGDGGSPEQAMLAALAPSVSAEQPNLALRYVDLPAGEAGARALLAEVSAPARGEIAAWRAGTRRVRTHRDVRVEPAADTVWQPEGAYLITGGLGGLGLALAGHLAEAFRARLTLVGRTGLPPRETWDDHLAAGDAPAATIAAVRQLELAGAEVLVVAGDIADPDTARRVVGEARARFGALDGVIHAAGVPGGGLLQGRTSDQVEAVLRPKLAGTLALAAALRDAPPRFLALFGSASSVLGGLGESDYAAANGFLDAWAAGPGAPAQRVVSIGWGAWQRDSWQARLFADVPELARRVRDYRDAHGITDAEGIELLTRILAGEHRNVLVLPQDAAATLETIAALASIDALTAPAAPRQRFPRPDLRDPYAPPRTPAQREIAAIWDDHLGVDGVGIDDPFFELGGNSLIGLTVLAAMERALGLALAPSVLFERPTVRALAALVEGEDAANEDDLSDQSTRGERRRALAAATQQRRRT